LVSYAVQKDAPNCKSFIGVGFQARVRLVPSLPSTSLGLLNRTTINVVDMGALHPMADDNCWYQAIAQGIADFVFLAAPKYKKPNQAAGLSELQQKHFLLDPSHVAGLRSLLPVDDLELNLIAFLQTLISLDVDRAVMHEYICTAILTTNEAKAFCVIEPLHGSFHSHVLSSSGQRPSAAPPRGMPVLNCVNQVEPEARVLRGLFPTMARWNGAC
jgi:hypothetical protein